MFVWLEKALVLAIHDRQLAEHGGSDGVRDLTLLESALAGHSSFMPMVIRHRI